MPIARALISVSNKTGIVEFARSLAQLHVDLLSTGGTYKVLSQEGVPVHSVDSFTAFPEIMDGRVKTLHPKIHGGILAVRDNTVHRQQMVANNILGIDLVVVNLYPFRETIAKPGVSMADAIENIDIGGPAMVRSSAKNHAWVTVIVDPLDYPLVIKQVTENGEVALETRQKLAYKAFAHTSEYDAAIATYLAKQFKI